MVVSALRNDDARDEVALAAALNLLQERFGSRFTRGLEIRRQHANTTTWLPNEPADAVVFAASTEEVSEIVKICAEHRVPIIPFGTGTSLEGHVNAPKGGVSIDLSQMNKIVAVHAEDLDCTVEAGVTRIQLNNFIRDQGLFFPIDPGADASLGGMAATRASGTNAVRYGTMRENVVRLTAVMADGSIVRTGSRAKKSSAGYDLTRLLVGSEGTLGIITAVALRLYPRTDVRSVVLTAVESPAQALQLFEILFEQCGARLQAFEYFSGDCLDLVLTHAEGVQEPFDQRYPAYVLVELADTADEAGLTALLENVIGTALERGLCLDAAVSASLSQLQTLWKLDRKSVV